MTTVAATDSFLSKIQLKIFGVDAFVLEKKFLVFNLFRRNILVKYRRSFFGLLWTLLGPLGTSLVFYIVFQKIVVIEIPNYMAFLVTGLFPWIFFSSTVSEGNESIVTNAGLASRIPLPTQIFSYVAALTNFSHLIFCLPVIVATCLLSGIPVFWTWLIAPVYLFSLFIVTYSIAWILSITFVYFRDLRHALGLILQMGFYATPVFYSSDLVPAQFKFILFINPVTPALVGFRSAFLTGELLPKELFIAMVCWTFSLLTAAVLLHRKVSDKMVEVL